jgi:eukaryotic-like serine/threonine-protein kinase
MTAQPRRQEPRPPALFPEGVVAGRYRICGVLGVGGTGTVFEAVDVETDEAVALKAIPRDARLHKRARRELRVAAELDHPGIVRLIGSVEDDDYVYVALELVRGTDLAHAFAQWHLGDAALLRAVASVCDALAHAHARGIVHRDVKPGNVLLREDGALKLTDFGIALLDRPDATVDDRLLGTLSYMAPEQARGEPVTGAADVWAAALMLFEALAGENPYRARSPRELNERHDSARVSLAAQRPDLPAVVVREVDRALAPQPGKRPAAADLRDALLAGAIALERGEARDTVDRPFTLDVSKPGAARRFRGARRLRETLAERARRSRRSRLRVVPDTDAAAAHGGLHGRLADLGAALLAPAGVADARREALARTGAAVLAGGASAAALGSLAFYPTGWSYGLGLLIGVLALQAPSLAYGVAAALFLPLAGNVDDGLVLVAAVGALAWGAAIACAPRRAFLPALALPLTALGGLAGYLLLAGTARSARGRLALGAAGPPAIVLVAGLAGLASPIAAPVTGRELAASLAGDGSTPAAAQALWHAAGGSGLVAQALVWGGLALAAPPLLRLGAAPLRWYAALWLSAACAGTVLAPTLVGGAPAPLWPAAVGSILAGIVLGLRSTVVRRVDAAHGASIPAG